MKITPLIPGDLSAVKSIQPPDWNNIVPMHEFYLNSDFCKTFKCLVNDQVIAIGTAILHPEVAWIAHVIVAPEHRNKGLGLMLTDYLVKYIQSHHLQTIYLLATPLGEPVYKKLGFIPEGTYTFYREGLKPEKPTLECIQGYHSSYLSDILEMDYLAYGEPRELRLEPFLDSTLLYIENKKLIGFYVPDFGEGLIISKAKEAGIKLQSLRLQTQTVAIVPDDNKAMNEFFKQHQYDVFRNATRMRLGIERPLNPGLIYQRVSGQIG